MDYLMQQIEKTLTSIEGGTTAVATLQSAPNAVHVPKFTPPPKPMAATVAPAKPAAIVLTAVALILTVVCLLLAVV
tara:strand:- start:1851 stop:2078 length:228 start_codon:yes stop_codon:yes gene_type:complete